MMRENKADAFLCFTEGIRLYCLSPEIIVALGMYYTYRF